MKLRCKAWSHGLVLLYNLSNRRPYHGLTWNTIAWWSYICLANDWVVCALSFRKIHMHSFLAFFGEELVCRPLKNFWINESGMRVSRTSWEIKKNTGMSCHGFVNMNTCWEIGETCTSIGVSTAHGIISTVLPSLSGPTIWIKRMQFFNWVNTYFV
jgi:hypothetical protein